MGEAGWGWKKDVKNRKIIGEGKTQKKKIERERGEPTRRRKEQNSYGIWKKWNHEKKSHFK